jgi:phosphate transport system permease protein
MSDVILLGSGGVALHRRRRAERWFQRAVFAATMVGLVMLVVLLTQIGRQGLTWLSARFLTAMPSMNPHQAGILPALVGSVYTVTLTGLLAVPLGVAAAIYLEEFSGRGRLARAVEVNIANLAGVPAIIYGMLGLALFVRGLQLGRGVLSGALTLALLVLPVIILASREAIRAVPSSLRQAAVAVGATPWQTVRHHVLPAALPGILTGVILALSRAIGEAAPLVVIGAAGYVSFLPNSLHDRFTALPIQIFFWSGMPRREFQNVAAAGILVLLAVLLSMNALAVVIRQRAARKLRWS